MDCSPPCSSVQGDFPGKTTGVGCPVLLQGLFPKRGPSVHLLDWQADRCAVPVMTSNLPLLIPRPAIPASGWLFLSHRNPPSHCCSGQQSLSHCFLLTGVTFLPACYACFTRLDCFAQHRHPQQQEVSEREMSFWRGSVSLSWRKKSTPRNELPPSNAF